MSLKKFIKHKVGIILVLIISLSFVLNVIKQGTPPCVNADEAAFAYNAYSLLKTGSDEYGAPFPVRLKSFGDYKMPLYSYGSIPFIFLFGLNELGARAFNTLLITLLPLAIFFLTKELFNKKSVALLAAFLTGSSLALHIVGRQAHEALLSVFAITLTSLFFVKYIKTGKYRFGLLFSILLFISLFTYQSARIFGVMFFILSLFYFAKKKFHRNILFTVILALFIFLLTDLRFKPTRIENLLFFRTTGFAQKIYELRTEGGQRFFYNKLTIGIRDISLEYTKYFSPDFLIINGDENPRFGFRQMSPLTIVEYIFVFIGIYYLFKTKHKWKWHLLGLLFISPISGSLSWASNSLTRTLFIFIPIFIIAAYGIISFIDAQKKTKLFWIGGLIATYLFFSYYSWDFYLNHYSKRAYIQRAWQCGYKELTKYVKKNYDKFDRFYISTQHGQPYVFLLYFLNYSPIKYQPQARISAPDEYGFGQVIGFDKFHFVFPKNKDVKKTVFVGYPDDFTWLPQGSFQKIKIGTEEMFWIYETK